MPIVALPDGRAVEFPEGASPELITGALRKDFPQFFGDPERTVRKERLQQEQAAARTEGDAVTWGTGYRAEQAGAFGNLARGVAQVPAGTLKFAGTVADAVRRYVPDEGMRLDAGGDQSALTSAGEWIEQQANRLPGTDPEALDAQFQTGIGQLGGMMTGGYLVGQLASKAVTRGALAAGASEKAAERLAGRAARSYGQGGAVAAGFGQEFSDANERALRLGDDPDTALAKSLGYASVATMIESAAGAGRLFRQYFPSPQQAQQALTKLGVSRAIAGNFLAGYGEEASQRIAQNVIVEPGSDLLAGAHEEGRVGALVQGLVGLPAAGRGYRPVTTRTPDGREVIVNQATGGTEFGALPSAVSSQPAATTARFRGPNGEDIQVDLGGATLEQAQAAIFRQQPGAEFVGVDLPPATPPTTAAPAATAEAATPGLSQAVSPEPAPVLSPVEPAAPVLSEAAPTLNTVRGEAAMETRPSATWTPDGRRTPPVDPDLAAAIEALRQGYRPEVEAQQATPAEVRPPAPQEQATREATKPAPLILWTASTPTDNVPVQGVWDVVDANHLRTSFDPDYDQSLQPRDRTRQASSNQIARLAQRFEPQRAGESATTDMGAPIVDERGQVLSGNGRVSALRTLYGSENVAGEKERSEGYKLWLIQNADRWGVDPSRIRGLTSPVLVRRVTNFNGLSKQEFARQSNQQQVLGQSEAEQAGSDARMLAENQNLFDALTPNAEGDVLAASNREFLNGFIQGVGGAAELLTKEGSYTPALKRRVQNAVLGALVGPENRSLLGSLIERGEELGVKTQVNALIALAPRLARLRGTPFELGDVLERSLADLVRFKSGTETLTDFLGQQSLIGDENRTADTDQLFKFLAEAKSAKAIGEALDRYTRAAQNAIADAQSGGMFGSAPATRAEVIQSIYGRQPQSSSTQTGLTLGEPAPPRYGRAEAGQRAQPADNRVLPGQAGPQGQVNEQVGDIQGRQQRGDAARWQLLGAGKQPEQADLYVRHALRHRVSKAATVQLQRASAAAAAKAQVAAEFPLTPEGALDFKRATVPQIDSLFATEREELDALNDYWREVDKSGVTYPKHAAFLARVAKQDLTEVRERIAAALRSTSKHPEDVRLRNELQARWLETSGRSREAARALEDVGSLLSSGEGQAVAIALARPEATASTLLAEAEPRAQKASTERAADASDAYLANLSANPFLDPRFWKAALVSGARILRNLGQWTATRAQWGAAMVKQFGERIRRALDATWSRLMRLQTQQANGVGAVGQGHLNQIEVASGNTNVAEEAKPVYSPDQLALGKPGPGVTAQPMSRQLAYFGGKDLLAAKQKLDVTGALQAAAVKQQSDNLWQQLVDSSAKANPLTSWRLPNWMIGTARARAFKTRVLHIAARLNATGRDAAGNFTFADFTMRAGTMSLGTAKDNQLSVGDQFTVNDPLTGVTETLTLGPIITTPEGRVFHQLARPVEAATQKELYDHFSRAYPEMIWFLDMFIDPALAGLRQTINGIEVPVFNRFAAAAMMAEGNPNFTALTAYTPDVLVTRSLIGSIRGALSFRAGTRSPGRKYKSGTSREGGHVRDLLSGFNVRSWQMLQEKSRREWMQAVLKTATPIRQNQVPEGWVKLETGMEELWQAVKRLRNWNSGTDPATGLPIFPETERRLKDDQSPEYKAFFLEAMKLRGKHLMLPKALVDQLVRKYVAHVEHGTLFRLGSWLVRNSTQLFLVAPVTVVNNVLTNDLFTLQAATRRILMAVANGRMQDARFARELFTAEFFKWFPGLRTLVDPQWRATMNAGVLPENLFADQTVLADLKVRLDEDPLSYLRQGEIGAAALQFIRYGSIDVRAKTRMAYAWLRAQAVTNARRAGLRGTAQRAAVDAYLANPPVADIASAVEVAGFELLNYADSPAWLEDVASGRFRAFGANVDVGDFTRLVMPFPRFGYHFIAKTAREAAAVKVFLGKVPKGQRADAFADLITFLMWPAGGLGLLAAYGLKGFGDDDDEARKRVGTASVKSVDAVGNVVSKPLPRDLITSNRINLSAWARGLGLGTDREEDFWLRVRAYPVIAMAGAALLAEEDARKLGAAEGAATYAGAVKDLASDFFSVGMALKAPAKVLNDLGNTRNERTFLDPYAAGVPTVAYVADQTLDSFIPGSRQFDIAIKWLDPIARRRAASKTLDFQPGVWESLRVGHVTGLLDRLFAGQDGTTASTLPPEGKVDRRSGTVLVPQEYSLTQRLAELGGFNLRLVERQRYEEALSRFAE